MKLNIFDKNILAAIDKNCRMPFSDIGRTIKRSPQFIKYRFDKLHENKTILHLYTAVDPASLGYRELGYFIKMQGVELAQEQQLLDYFYKHSFITKIYRMEGYYDYYLACCVQNLEEFSTFLNETYGRYGPFFIKFDNVNDLQSTYYDKNYLLGRKMETTLRNTQPLRQEDRKILSSLVKNPRITLVQLGKEHNISIETARLSLERIQKSISRLSFIMNPKEIYHHLIFIKLKQYSQEEEKKVQQFCNINQNITEYTRSYGTWDLRLHVEIEDREQFRQLLREIKFLFEKNILTIEYCYIFAIDKYRSIPIEYPFQEQ